MKKFVLRTVSVILSFLLIAAAMPAAGAASAQWSDDPVILVPGYSSSTLMRTREDGSLEKVWGLDFAAVGNMVLENIAEIALGLGGAVSGTDPAYLAQIVGEASIPLLDAIRCNPDGSSVYEVDRLYSDPANTNNAYYLAHRDDPDVINGMYEQDIMGDIGKMIGDENVFNFNCDFRMGAIACAERLYQYVLDVLAYTGKEQVNIIAISHGGQVAGTFLSLHGTEGLVNNAVLIVPALQGAGLAYDFFRNEIDFDEETLVRFLQHGFMSETDYEWLVKANAAGFLDDVIENLIPYFLQSVQYWGSLWDFMPPEHYEEMKAKMLDAEESAALIAQSDRMHKEIMPYFTESFARCRDSGVNLNIIAGTDNPIVTGWKVNSDAIITVPSASGAYTAPYGMRFADGYSGKMTVCADDAHCHISPAMTVDASCAYLPENTFFVEGLFHGMEYWDPYTSDLLEILLLTDAIQDVYSDAAYPQFHATTNPEAAVTAVFDKSPEGRVCREDTALVVRNLSAVYSVFLVSVDTAGLGVVIPTNGEILAPGESVRLPVRGTLTDGSLKKGQVTVHYYTSLETGTPFGSRTLSFTLMDGKAAEYDAENPYAPLNVQQSLLEQCVGEQTVQILEKLGLLELVEMFFDMFYTIYKNIMLLLAMG